MYYMHERSNQLQKPCIQALVALYGACMRSCDISETPEVTCKVATQVATLHVTCGTLAFSEMSGDQCIQYRYASPDILNRI